MSVLFPLRLSLQVAAVATCHLRAHRGASPYILARKRFRGKEFLDLVLTLPMVLPPVVTGYILLLLIGNRGPRPGVRSDDRSAIRHRVHLVRAALASFVVSFPFLIKTARVAMEGVDQNL